MVNMFNKVVSDYADYRNQMQGTTVPTPPKPVNPSCFGNIEDVVGSAQSTAARVERVVNRLVGEEPETASNELDVGASGLLNVANLHARDIRACHQRILNAIERLEKNLP